MYSQHVFSHTRGCHTRCPSIHVQNLRVACWLLATKSKNQLDRILFVEPSKHPGLQSTECVCVCFFQVPKTRFSCTGNRPHDFDPSSPRNLKKKKEKKQFLQYLERGEIHLNVITPSSLSPHVFPLVSFFFLLLLLLSIFNSFSTF